MNAVKFLVERPWTSVYKYIMKGVKDDTLERPDGSHAHEELRLSCLQPPKSTFFLIKFDKNCKYQNDLIKLKNNT